MPGDIINAHGQLLRCGSDGQWHDARTTPVFPVLYTPAGGGVLAPTP
jgi:hypothetical protein